MKRSLQEVVELVVFGLIALLLGTGLLWLVGTVFGLVGTVLGWLAGLLWALLRFVVPVALIAGAVVLLVRAARGRGAGDAATTAAGTRFVTSSDAPTVDAEPLAVTTVEPIVPAEHPIPTEPVVPAPSTEPITVVEPDDREAADGGDVDPDRRPY